MKSLEENIVKICSEIYRVSEVDIKKHGRGYQNLVYEYKKENKDYILRISNSSTRSYIEIKSELEFLKHLSQFDVNVSLPVEMANGEAISRIVIAEKEFFAVTFEKAKGDHITYPDYLNNHEIFHELGKITGKLHRSSEKFMSEKNQRIDWKDNYYLKNFDSFVPVNEGKAISLEEQVKKIEKLSKSRNTFGLIHGDINVGNFFVDKSKITLFDFDECQNSWFIEDIAIQLFYTVYVMCDDSIEERNNKAKEFMQHFLKGYELEKSIDIEMLKLIPQFLMLREMIVHVGIYKMWDLDNLSGWASDYYRDSSKRILERTPIVNFDNEWYPNS